METKDWLLLLGVAATFMLGIANLIYNLRASKRSAFVNTVTTERIKWISKVRENISKLIALCVKWTYNRPPDMADLQQEMEQLTLEIRLQLNPKDPEDKEIERLLDRLPSWRQSMSDEEFHTLQKEITTSTQALLKREWDKVKDEAVNGDLRYKRWWFC
jgi:hypothetical protein